MMKRYLNYLTWGLGWSVLYVLMDAALKITIEHFGWNYSETGFLFGFMLVIIGTSKFNLTDKEGDNEMNVFGKNGKRIKKSDEDTLVKAIGPVYNKLTNGNNGIKLRIRVDDNDEYGFLRVAAIHEDGSEKETKIFIREFLSNDDEVVDRLKKDLDLE